MISIKDLEFRYPRSDFLLSVGEQEIDSGSKVAIVGPSGSGKTTLLNLISGIVVPDGGMVSVDGQLISGMTDSRRRDFRIAEIGMVFQQFELVDYLKVVDNILLPFLVNGSLELNGAVKQYAEELAAGMGLEEKLRRFPGQLSQGEQQRVAICRALITKPKLILADEPTGNLDPKNKGKILKLLFDSCERNQQTLVVVTHDVNILDGFNETIDFEQFRHEVEV